MSDLNFEKSIPSKSKFVIGHDDEEESPPPPPPIHEISKSGDTKKADNAGARPFLRKGSRKEPSALNKRQTSPVPVEKEDEEIKRRNDVSVKKSSSQFHSNFMDVSLNISTASLAFKDVAKKEQTNRSELDDFKDIEDVVAQYEENSVNIKFENAKNKHQPKLASNALSNHYDDNEDNVKKSNEYYNFDADIQQQAVDLENNYIDNDEIGDYSNERRNHLGYKYNADENGDVDDVYDGSKVNKHNPWSRTTNSDRNTTNDDNDYNNDNSNSNSNFRATRPNLREVEASWGDVGTAETLRTGLQPSIFDEHRRHNQHNSNSSNQPQNKSNASNSSGGNSATRVGSSNSNNTFNSSRYSDNFKQQQQNKNQTTSSNNANRTTTTTTSNTNNNNGNSATSQPEKITRPVSVFHSKESLQHIKAKHNSKQQQNQNQKSQHSNNNNSNSSDQQGSHHQSYQHMNEDDLRSNLIEKSKELENEIELYRKESDIIKSEKKKVENHLLEISNQREEVLKWCKDEKQKTLLWIEEQKQIIAKERRAVAKSKGDLQRSTTPTVTIRKEKQEIEGLQATIEKLKLDHDIFVKKTKANENRLYGNIKECNNHIEHLETQLNKYETICREMLDFISQSNIHLPKELRQNINNTFATIANSYVNNSNGNSNALNHASSVLSSKKSISSTITSGISKSHTQPIHNSSNNNNGNKSPSILSTYKNQYKPKYLGDKGYVEEVDVEVIDSTHTYIDDDNDNNNNEDSDDNNQEKDRKKPKNPSYLQPKIQKHNENNSKHNKLHEKIRESSEFNSHDDDDEDVNDNEDVITGPLASAIFNSTSRSDSKDKTLSSSTLKSSSNLNATSRQSLSKSQTISNSTSQIHNNNKPVLGHSGSGIAGRVDQLTDGRYSPKLTSQQRNSTLSLSESWGKSSRSSRYSNNDEDDDYDDNNHNNYEYSDKTDDKYNNTSRSKKPIDDVDLIGYNDLNTTNTNNVRKSLSQSTNNRLDSKTTKNVDGGVDEMKKSTTTTVHTSSSLNKSSQLSRSVDKTVSNTTKQEVNITNSTSNTRNNPIAASSDTNNSPVNSSNSNANNSSNNSSNNRTEEVLPNGKKIIRYRNGTVKEVDPNGCSIVRFTNGDYKHTDVALGIVIYYYAEKDTVHTTYKDGLEVYEFPNKQTEKHYPDGMKEILFPDKTKKFISPNGVEVSHFPDGVKLREYPDGRKEVIS